MNPLTSRLARARPRQFLWLMAGLVGVFTAALLGVATGAAATPTVIITINSTNTRPISPWIYGINFYAQIPNAPRNLTLDRMGGNRWTAYNWENNASNAGSDWYYSNDSYLGGGATPGEAVRPVIAADRARGMASLMTVQLQGYVAADKNGNVDLNDTNHLANRFKQIVYRKGAAFTATPSTTDAYVYMDEFLWSLRGKFAGDIFADPATPTFVGLDNEPELWSSTHAEIQSTAITPTSYIQKTIALASAIKDVAPGVQIFGPVHYGFNGIVNWQNAPGFTSAYWFTDKYLDDMKAASTAAGKRLLDVYDFHWYSEARGGGTRVTSLTGTNLTDAQIQAIVQCPRSLWDTTYREDSWIASYLNAPIYILRRLQTKIDARWPGTKLSITEYGQGGDNHIAGAIAEADNLGIFGQLGVFAANFWPTSSKYPFILAGFKMFRDYDGNVGSFGDISIPAASSDTAKVAVYVSRDSTRAGRYVIVALNRSTASQAVSFSGLAIVGTARVYRVQGTNPAPAFVGEEPVNLASWIVTLPPLSVSTLEITEAAPAGTYAAWRDANFPIADQSNDAVSGPFADPDSAGLLNLHRYAFNLPARGSVSTPVVPQVIDAGGQKFLAVSFNRRTQATDLFYLVENGTDLLKWSAVTTVFPGTPALVTVPDTVPVNSAPRRFLRVSVQYTP